MQFVQCRMNSSNVSSSDNSPVLLYFIFDHILFWPTVIFNGFLLYVFLAYRRLQTSFTIYIIAVLFYNLINVLIEQISDMFRQSYSTYVLGAVFCTIDLYFSWAIWGMTMHSHVLITLNRLWALFFPLSYRDHHTKKMALLFCLVTFVYVNLWTLPGLVLDGLYYRKPLDVEKCHLNGEAQVLWSMIVMFVVYDLPIVIIVFAFPLLYCRQRQLKAKVIGVLNLKTESPTIAQLPDDFKVQPRKCTTA